MKLSIVTSTFNGAPFLPRCLESASADRCEIGLQHIVTDAASTDGSLEILISWEARHRAENPEIQKSPFSFRYLSEPDRGQSDGFNKGVALADSEWICWLNADDELAPGAVEAFHAALRRTPDADLIYGHVEFIDEESRHVKTCYTFPYFHWLIRNNVWLPPSSGTFFRRELFVQEPLDPDYHYVMDVEWFLRAGRNLKGVLVDRVMSRFRISTQGKTSEMITKGTVTERHFQERERYRRKYIYSQWPALSEAQARRRLARRQKLAMIPYYLLKLRYLPRYLKDKAGF